MSGGGKGGNNVTTTTMKLPKEVEDQAKANIRIANEVAGIGYTPYQGNTVAAFSPNQIAAMRNNAGSMNAFNMHGAGENLPDDVNRFTGMTMNANNQGGIRGYSPMGQYNEAIQAIPAAQRGMINSFTMNPRTGQSPTNPTVPPIEYKYTPPTPKSGGKPVAKPPAGYGQPVQKKAGTPAGKGGGNGILGDALNAKANHQRGR